jgi:hypothetical protein
MGVYTALQAILLRAQSWTVTPTRGNDYSVHTAMVRWAARRIEEGHLPLDGWFPGLSFGGPHFHQYQSFPHVVAGYLAQLFDPNDIVQWTGYLLLVAWPLLMFVGVRMLTGDDLVAVTAGVLSPLLSSLDGFGYEYQSYIFGGSGLWANLIAMSLVPFAVALTWRALDRGRGYAVAALALGFTVVAHFHTGWLMFVWLGAVALAGPGRFVPRLRRAAVVGAGALAVSSFVVVPLIVDAKWVAQTQILPARLHDSYGARQILQWLFRGQLFDAEHTWYPLVSVLVAIGVVVCIARWQRDALGRTVLVFSGICLVLYFGRPTLGPVLDVLPFTRDMLLHRMIAGVHLGGLLLAAIGASATIRAGLRAYHRFSAHTSRTLFVALVALLAILIVAPVWSERADFLAGDRLLIERQQRASARDEPDLEAVVDYAKRRGGGRIYAGAPNNYGGLFQIGYSTVYVEVTQFDGLGAGFTGRVASLSLDPELEFDSRDAALYPLFGVRYLIMPDAAPPVPAILIYQRGRFRLFEVPDQRGYLGVYDSVGPAIRADRTDMAEKIYPYLHSDLPARKLLQPIAFDGDRAARPTVERGDEPRTAPGRVLHEHVAPDDGEFSGRVVADRRSVVLLKESFHGRWEVTVDGRTRKAEMFTPSFVGVTVGPGEHRVEFRYVPYPATAYALWALLGMAALVVLAVVPRWLATRTARTRKEGPASGPSSQ